MIYDVLNSLEEKKKMNQTSLQALITTASHLLAEAKEYKSFSHEKFTTVRNVLTSLMARNQNKLDCITQGKLILRTAADLSGFPYLSSSQLLLLHTIVCCMMKQIIPWGFFWFM